jgi:NAD(P)-dependent dehydrogenase (short-subunit alcohol dehydrogenase family)
MPLADKVAIVTGASRGIGAAIVETLAERDATVIASAHAADPPDTLVAGLRARELRVHGRIADVSDPEQVQNLADATREQFGRIDVLINNAGIGAVAPTETLSFERWSRVLAVNLTGPLLCSQAVGRHMLQAGRGVIINIGSIFGEVGMPMRAAYAASKHGLVGLTRVLAVEWASQGVRVVTVEPAYVSTGLDEQDQKDGAYSPDDIIGRTPMGRTRPRPPAPPAAGTDLVANPHPLHHAWSVLSVSRAALTPPGTAHEVHEPSADRDPGEKGREPPRGLGLLDHSEHLRGHRPINERGGPCRAGGIAVAPSVILGLALGDLLADEPGGLSGRLGRPPGSAVACNLRGALRGGRLTRHAQGHRLRWILPPNDHADREVSPRLFTGREPATHRNKSCSPRNTPLQTATQSQPGRAPPSADRRTASSA